jgi:hypothetical protein
MKAGSATVETQYPVNTKKSSATRCKAANQHGVSFVAQVMLIAIFEPRMTFEVHVLADILATGKQKKKGRSVADDFWQNTSLTINDLHHYAGQK